MAIRISTIKDFKSLIRDSKGAVIKGHTIALIETGQEARRLALINIKNNFSQGDDKTGRKRTGGLTSHGNPNVIIESSPSQLPKVFLAMRGIPYAAIHEFGDTVTPNPPNKNLWVKIDYRTPYRRLTPREFINKKKTRVRQGAGAKSWSIFRSKKGNLIAAEVRTFKTVPARVRPLFVLKKSVTIPDRPYLRPAAEEAGKKMAALSITRITEQFARRRK